MERAGSYGGDVTPQEAWEALARDPGTRLVDVRTQPEWTFVGIPDLSGIGKKVILASWQSYPAMSVDPDFVAKVRAQAGNGGLYFLCRSGARSRAAAIAMTAAGAENCFNIVGGFEGDRDADGHRGAGNGWKAAGLPWKQD